MAGPVRRLARGIELAVKVKPRASCDALAGRVVDSRGAAWLMAKVRAAPEAGRANAAVIALLARHLEVAASAISLTQGSSAPWKRFAIVGDPDRLGPAAERLGDP